MKKRAIWSRILSLVMALTMCLPIPLTAFAEETVTGQVGVETTAGNVETVDVTIKINETTNEDGTKTSQTTLEAVDVKTESGMTVDYNASAETVRDGEEVISGKAESHYTAVNQDSTYGAEGGSELTIEPVAPDVTVDIPLTDEDNSETEEVDNVDSATSPNPAGAVLDVTGDVPESETDGEYDYTITEVVQPGSATVTTTDITVTASVDKTETDMEYIHSDAEATSENDLIAGSLDEEQNVQDGYTHVLAGTDNYSGFAAALLWREGLPGEEPVYTDENGVNYYVCANHQTMENRGLYVDGYYVDGEYIEDKNYARYDHIQQFVLIDAQTGELLTVYCADQKTRTQEGYSYIMENVEDADYYSDTQAEMIRTVALNGYWGTESGMGSLEEMREKLAASGEFTEDEIASLTDGIAMTATQYAIWSFSNVSNGDKYVNVYQLNDDLEISRVPGEDSASVDLIFKLYHYLINLDPMPSTNTTADTIINEQNFLKDMSVTVIEKAENHANNQDSSDTNDAYITDLTFALVVTPSTENGDDLVVSVLDANSNVVACGRIAGEPSAGETVLIPDENGNYSFHGITLTEGSQSFNITLDGIQNLSEGVYLYTSEVRVVEGEEVPSQTMVGVASGKRDVNVTMNIAFELNVTDEIVARERVWRTEWRKSGGGGSPGDSEDPEKVELAKAPKTGDGTLLYTILSSLSGLGLMVMQLFKKQKKTAEEMAVPCTAEEQIAEMTETMDAVEADLVSEEEAEVHDRKEVNPSNSGSFRKKCVGGNCADRVLKRLRKKEVMSAGVPFFGGGTRDGCRIRFNSPKVRISRLRTLLHRKTPESVMLC